MKYGILSVTEGVNDKINIGDFVQSLASRQYFPQVDVILERETDLQKYDGDEIAMIMNGWFMNRAQNWPPSSKIHPLFVSLHVNHVCKLDKFFSPSNIEYFKKYQPIGCRDTNTVEKFKQHGIDAYYTGCLTLTLGNTYHSDEKDGKIYIVEPPSIQKSDFIFSHPSLILKSFLTLLLHFSDIAKIAKKNDVKKWKDYFCVAYYYRQYSKVFDKQLLVEAEYINQYNTKIGIDYPTPTDKLEYAEKLIRKYARASCVITSRIHCALPCLGLETPVIFVEDINGLQKHKCRYGGIKDLFNVITWDGFHLFNDLTHEKITKTNFPRNKQIWRQYADSLTRKCNEFVNSISKDT